MNKKIWINKTERQLYSNYGCFVLCSFNEKQAYVFHTSRLCSSEDDRIDGLNFQHQLSVPGQRGPRVAAISSSENIIQNHTPTTQKQTHTHTPTRWLLILFNNYDYIIIIIIIAYYAPGMSVYTYVESRRAHACNALELIKFPPSQHFPVFRPWKRK